MRSPSLTLRISLLFAAAVSVVLLVTGYFLACAVERHFIKSDSYELEGKLQMIRHLVEQTGDTPAKADLAKQIENTLIGHTDISVAIVNADNSVQYATPKAYFPAAMLNPPPAGAHRNIFDCAPQEVWQWRHEDRDYRGMSQPMALADGDVQRVAVAIDIGRHQAFMDRFRFTLGLALALAALTTAGLGWFATYRGLASLRHISRLAAGITAKHLTTRLPEEGSPPELRSLAQSFNEMLARLDEAFRRLSEFSADLAHELRTPISNLQTQTQVILSRTRTAQEYRAALQSSAEEYERLARMINDMLFLAKADNRLLVPKLERFEVANMAAGVIEFLGILAEEHGIRLVIAGSVTVTADRLLLHRVITNLMSNAIRHCQPGGTITIRLSSDGAGALIVVENPGSIPTDHLPHLFERFYTGDPARHRGGEGAGLGLAIVRSIIEAHRGEITAESNAGLTRFCIRLPASEPRGLPS